MLLPASHIGSMDQASRRFGAHTFLGCAFCFVTAFVAVAPVAGQGRGAIVGTVLDASTNAPLPGANVLVGSTTLGTSTDEQGRFVISGVPVGPWTLSASMIGYDARTEEVGLWAERDTVRIDFRLTPHVYGLDEIEVTGERPSGWDRDYRLFRRLFLGESENAGEVVITNPYVLDFRRSDLVFYASASAPLLIENHALGYRVRYVLRLFRWSRNPDHLSFQGEPYFTEMEPESEEERRRWDENRAVTFRGSRQHFLWALGRELADDEGFTMEWGALEDRPGEVLPIREAGLVDAESILGGKSRSYDYILTFDGHIIVSYETRTTIYLFGVIPLPNTKVERSVMRMDAHEAMVHTMGYFLGPPGAMVFAGHWGEERIADLLPLDYVHIWEEHAQKAEPQTRL